MTERLRGCIDVEDGRPRDEAVGRAVDGVVGDGLRVIRDKHGNGAVDAAGDNALRDGQRKRKGKTTHHHLAEQAILGSSHGR